MRVRIGVVGFLFASPSSRWQLTRQAGQSFSGARTESMNVALRGTFVGRVTRNDDDMDLTTGNMSAETL